MEEKKFDKDINVRSKDDTEIDVGMIVDDLEENIAYMKRNKFDEMVVDRENMQNYLDLIHRLQSENAEQKEEIERLTKTLDVCNEQLYRSCMDKGELQKQVDELKEELKTVQNSCHSKNAKNKNLTEENEMLKNEINFQNGKPHYRYVVWNTKQNKRQFPSICELSESGAYTKLFQKIGWDSAKYRFEVRRIKVDGVEVE